MHRRGTQSGRDSGETGALVTAPAYDVCVVGGLGHVGLPLGISLAASGRRVVLFDVDERARALVSSGRMPFREVGAEEVLGRVLGDTLFLAGDRQAVADSHFVIVVIGTPVDEHLSPEFGLFRTLVSEMLDVIRDGHHVILRSTVFPGTTEWTRDFLRANGRRTRVSFCPERICQGEAMEELRSLPQIVASFDEESRHEAGELFGALTGDIVFLQPREAELAKLFTNVWRYIQFATANQFFQIASESGLDFYRIYQAITRNYPRTRHLPTAGFAAGPCLFKDTMQLAAYSNNSFFLGHAAMLINEGLPNHIVHVLKQRLPLHEMVVGILGMAFKANSDDGRQSLSFKLRKLFEIEARSVLASDVYLNGPGFVSAAELVERADVIIVGSPHREYRDLVIAAGKPVVDVWNFFGRGSGI
jgi:UDP-N-acetyl-D-mannosaminuronic acid dehydrogenase